MVDVVNGHSVGGGPALVPVVDTSGGSSLALAVVIVGEDGVAQSSAAEIQYTEDAVAAANPVGTMMIAVRRDTLVTNEVTADGDNIALKATNKGALHIRALDIEALLPAALAANGGLKVEGVAGGVAQPVSGPQTNTEFLAALRSTATHSAVSSAATSTTILAANANRKGARIFNTDANALYLDLSGGTAVAASRAQVKLATDEGYDVPFGLTGLITGIWAADGAGAASVVEFA